MKQVNVRMTKNELMNKAVTSVVFHVRWLVPHYVALGKAFMSIMKY